MKEHSKSCSWWCSCNWFLIMKSTCSRPLSQFLSCWIGLEQLVLILRHALPSMDLKELQVLIQISGIRLNWGPQCSGPRVILCSAAMLRVAVASAPAWDPTKCLYKTTVQQDPDSVARGETLKVHFVSVMVPQQQYLGILWAQGFGVTLSSDLGTM